MRKAVLLIAFLTLWPLAEAVIWHEDVQDAILLGRVAPDSGIQERWTLLQGGCPEYETGPNGSGSVTRGFLSVDACFRHARMRTEKAGPACMRGGRRAYCLNGRSGTMVSGNAWGEGRSSH